ncbi:hypothetical protein JT362_26025 [Actinophytocola sp. S1-96]|uniref:AlgX/AlgJ SGNH hydrolase-like domain-containing protein n=2 Tax=Actinophytocola gossypii TaxID=2812003 RepID=A0ABT2JGN1_9PSEU|nr:hypothetical protein [Actinophytocola gossypii]
MPREHALHRPRHGGRQLTALVSALVFFAAPALMWIGGMRPVELENHELTGFPSVFDGWGFLTGMDPWATDNLVFRAQAIDAAGWVSETFFGEPAPFDQGTSAPTGPLPGGPGGPSSEPDNPNNEPNAAGYRRVIEGEDGWLYLGEDVTGKCQSGQSFGETAQRIGQLRDAVEASGRTFVMVAVPDKWTMVPENLPDSYAGKKCAEEATPKLWSAVSSVDGVLDMRDPLRNVAEQFDRPPYYSLDSHWTNEGALEMVRQLAERLEPDITESWEIRERGEVTVHADLPPLIGREGDNRAITYELAADGESFENAGVLPDLRAPVRRTPRPTTGMVHRPTLVLGDSFTLPVSAYLPAAFSDVTQLYYTTVDDDAGMVARTMAANEVVVLQIVERAIARGNLGVLSEEFIATVRQELQKRPIR